jgi:diguanylate cyclase (GGDEF)-like protein
MGAAARPAPVGLVASVRLWPIWRLQTWLLVYVLSVIAAGAVALATSLVLSRFTFREDELFAVLMACDVITVELTKRSGEPAGLIKEVHAVWELPLALLLPPAYALITPIVRMSWTQWRVRRALAYRRVFSMAELGLSYALASVTFHALAPDLVSVAGGGAPGRIEAWALAVVACGVLRSVAGKVILTTAIKGSDPGFNIRADLLSREELFGDAAELSVGVLVAYAVTLQPLMALFALPCVTLLQRSLRHAQLVRASRIDGKTGVLNGVTWQREAGVRVTRASGARTAPLAVLLADVDRFKTVNDTWGHKAGDVVLSACARMLTEQLRADDLIGRYGNGDEFAILLPATSATEATTIARRLCVSIAELTIPDFETAIGTAPPRITISIGVAALGTHQDLDELIVAADTALYRAKRDGRNTVRTDAD